LTEGLYEAPCLNFAETQPFERKSDNTLVLAVLRKRQYQNGIL
jgi:hypothetical protein